LGEFISPEGPVGEREEEGLGLGGGRREEEEGGRREEVEGRGRKEGGGRRRGRKEGEEWDYHLQAIDRWTHKQAWNITLGEFISPKGPVG
jgi:hypothetical protein